MYPQRTGSSLNIMSHDADTMFSLPDELLIRIFHEFVDEDHSPVLLSHICQLWRHLVFQTSSLWSIINLRSVRRAKHHLALAQDHPLVVTWLYTRQAHPVLERYEWIFSHAPRFIQLGLVLPGPTIVELLDRLGDELSQLQNLTIAGHSFWFPCTLGSMPNLRILSLSDINLEAGTFNTALCSCPLLEVLELSHINIMMSSHRTPASLELSHLRSCTLAFMNLKSQGYLTSFIVLPKQSVLNIAIEEDELGNSSPEALHPATIAMLQPIRITTVYLHPQSILFTESQQDSRCKLELCIESELPGELTAIMPPGFDLTSVTTLDIDGIRSLDGLHVLYVLGQVLPCIRQLVIHTHALQKLLACSESGFKLFATASRLETITFQDVTFDTCSEAGVENVQEVCKLVDQIRSGKQAALSRLVLRGCKTNQEGLDTLRAVLPVIWV
ncbi:hypothetical protein BDY19DRAFT_321687 [Irpex rosettiformis]|uniref:Uncharacterized protein n=1 Tax=Irpex rosettiformis TaxID=378272 RepID=A0ACB8TYH8_9APHY|nr:hypothetical protein BDY19DRAFT_321687 [Irpex rosettiformis]